MRNKRPLEITFEKDKKDETGMKIRKWLEEKPIWRQLKGARGFMQFRSQFNRLYIVYRLYNLRFFKKLLSEFFCRTALESPGWIRQNKGNVYSPCFMFI